MVDIKRIQLKAKKDEGIRRRHPWVFSGAIKNLDEGILDGDLVQVCSNKGGHLGYGALFERNLNRHSNDFF